MEKMPYQAEAEIGIFQAACPASAPVTTSDWRQALPVLTAGHVTLRELRISDAASLFAMLTSEEVARFISPPPTTVEGFERFIAWAQRQRAVEVGERLRRSAHLGEQRAAVAVGIDEARIAFDRGAEACERVLVLVEAELGLAAQVV